MAGTPASSRTAFTGSYPIVNADVAVGAAIVYSKLSLALSIVNADIAAAAAIAVSKLAAGTAGQVLGGTGPSYALPPGYEFNYVEITSNVTISATSEATPDTVVTAGAVTFDGATTILVEFYCQDLGTGTGAASVTTLNLWDGATDLGRIAEVKTPAAAVDHVPCYVARRLTPSAAAHTYSVVGWRASSNGTVFAGAGGVGTVMPAFIRITKV